MAAPVALQPGQVIQALVLELIDSTVLRLQIPGGTMDVASPVALPPGTTVALAVGGTLSKPTIALTPLPAGSRVQPPVDPSVGAPAAANSDYPELVAAARTGAPVPSGGQPDLAALLRLAVTGIVRDAAARQDGLAPLYADLEAALARPDSGLPPAVRGAAGQLLALRLAGGTSGQIAAGALAGGSAAGLGPDFGAGAVAKAPAGLAVGSASETSPQPASRLSAPPWLPSATPAVEAIESALLRAGIAPTESVKSEVPDVAEPPASEVVAPPLAPSTDEPAVVWEAANETAAAPAAPLRPAAELPAGRMDAAGITANDIKSAVLRAGLLVGTKATDPAPDAVDSRLLGGGPVNFKSALLSLRQSLKEFIATPGGGFAPAAANAAGELKFPPRLPVAPPPHREGPVVAQAPVATSLPEDIAPRALALHLLDATDAALSRHMLLQVASLPGDPSAGHNRSDAVRLTFDLPLTTQQGTGVAQIRIERDGTGQGGAEVRPAWRASFSIDLEPIGRVHARIALIGDRAAVTLSAERASSAEWLRQGLPLLAAGLQEAALEPGEMLCRSGVPPAAPVAPGLFVDHAS
jgi:hypothetical protein